MMTFKVSRKGDGRKVEPQTIELSEDKTLRDLHVAIATKFSLNPEAGYRFYIAPMGTKLRDRERETVGQVYDGFAYGFFRMLTGQVLALAMWVFLATFVFIFTRNRDRDLNQAFSEGILDKGRRTTLRSLELSPFHVFEYRYERINWTEFKVTRISTA